MGSLNAGGGLWFRVLEWDGGVGEGLQDSRNFPFPCSVTWCRDPWSSTPDASSLGLSFLVCEMADTAGWFLIIHMHRVSPR